MSSEQLFDRTQGKLRIVSAGAFDQYKVFVDGVEIDGTFGNDVLNSLARGGREKFGIIETRFQEQTDRLPPGLTADKFFFLMRGFGPVPELMPPPELPPSLPSATA
jgi:hypothetical protein